MVKIKIFTANNVQGYGFSDEEIAALNAEWEQKATELGLAEHMPEYWREAKQHVGQIVEARGVTCHEGGAETSLDEGLTDLPSLDVELDDFSANEAAADITVPEEAVELESIDIDELLDVEEDVAEELLPDLTPFAEIPEEVPEQGLAAMEESPVVPLGQEGIVEVVEETAVVEISSAAAKEDVVPEVPLAEPLAGEEVAEVRAAAEEKEAVAEKAVLKEEAGEERAIGEEREAREQSFFGGIFSRLKKIFGL
ncbi:MAG: hypothetical protein BM485_07270 [Desulfobulbaceae bacterium DB1]|nr:MAG: hypothetical protein BM485_07270 [Desulfobulbaceae bacterium DB1]